MVEIYFKQEEQWALKLYTSLTTFMFWFSYSGFAGINSIKFTEQLCPTQSHFLHIMHNAKFVVEHQSKTCKYITYFQRLLEYTKDFGFQTISNQEPLEHNMLHISKIF